MAVKRIKKREFLLVAGCDPDPAVQKSYIVDTLKELIKEVQQEWNLPASRIREAAREAILNPDGSSSYISVPSICRDCEFKNECKQKGWMYRIAFDILKKEE